GVAYIRERWRRSPAPDVMLRNLHNVHVKEALDLVLEVASALDDRSPLLGVLAQALVSHAATEPARSGPLWRRIVAQAPPLVRDLAIRELVGIAHVPVADLLVPLVAEKKTDPAVRRDALLACRD